MHSHSTTMASTNWELSPVLSKYLDRHLVFPLLEFLQVRAWTV